MRNGRATKILVLAIMLVSGLLMATRAQATPGLDDYSFKNDAWCMNWDGMNDNPPKVLYYNSSGTNCKQASLDGWGFYKRECTSFVTWRMRNDNEFGNFTNTMTGPSGKSATLGDAGNWGVAAQTMGYLVDNQPTVGSVAWWDAGHVAWVKSVSGGNVVIEEYNYGWNHSYGTRTIAAGSPNGYIHFKDLVGSGSTANAKKDLVVYNPDATWAVASSNGSSFAGVGIGLSGWGRGDWTGLGDVNGDGFDDIVIHNPAYARFDVALNNKAGAFNAPGGGTWLWGWGAGDWAALGDLNGDKKADLVVHNPVDNTWSVAVSNGSSFSGAGIGLYGWGKGDWAGLADVTGDGKADIVVHDPANARYAVAVNSGAGQFNGAGTGAWLNGWGAGEWVGLGDINKDSRADLVVYANATWSVAVSTGGSFAGGGIALSGWGRGDWTSLSDVTGDGAADVVIHNPAYARFDVAVNNGTGGFGAAGTGTWLSGWGVGDWAASGNVA